MLPVTPTIMFLPLNIIITAFAIVDLAAQDRLAVKRRRPVAPDVSTLPRQKAKPKKEAEPVAEAVVAVPAETPAETPAEVTVEA